MTLFAIPRAIALLVATAALARPCAAVERDVQIKSVEFATGVVTIFNYGTTDQSLASYRLCTADNNESFRYTIGGLTGFTIEAGTEFRLHFNNDAPGTDPTNEINVSALGGFTAQPIDHGPYGLALYFATPFNTPDNMADYVQWTNDLSNPENQMADNRAPTAVAATRWAAVDDWVVSTPESTGLAFTGDPDPLVVHDSDDYDLVGPPPCPADLDGSGDVGFGDVLAVIGAWGACAGCPEDLDGSGDVGFGDLLDVIGTWGPCG